MSETRGLVEVIDALWGGAITTLAAALAGRLMWHSTEVRARRRRFFGRELLWELPVAIGMAIIGEAVAAYFGLSRTVTTGVIASLSYLGPRGAEALLRQIFAKDKEG
ncbi:phage holin family protein [Rhodobacter capsulatus]|uniref:phage holin family protein n=1 Tax=Rhodobacter capsulatus TaxID=1061 RepID=UPI00402A5744